MAMTATDLETILVSDLELGMIVHGIAEQAGKLVVKSKGTVRHLNLIEQLSSHGVISVYVQRPAPISNASLEKLNSKKQALQKAKQAKQELKERPSVLNDLSIELEQASKLIKQSNAIQKRFAASIKTNANIDVSDAKDLVSGIYASLARNPNALLCLSMLMHSNDYLANHAVHVSILLCHFAQQMGMSEADCERLGLLGYVFDIGMVKVPSEILNKKDALTKQEQTVMQSHVLHSLDIVKPLKLDSEIMLAIEQHHERLDGSGYPRGYSGSKISKFSRMLAIADCYDALTTTRPFSQSRSPAAAMKILSNPDFGYDQKLVLQFIRHLGIYPVGSLVMLSNKRIAMVTQNNSKKPSEPRLKVFYSIAGGHYLSPTFINLAAHASALKIVKPVLASQYKLDMAQII